MNKKFDKNDVLRFIYKEMDPLETEAFIVALSTDEELWKEFEACQAAHENLESVRTEPSELAVTRILDHAKLSRRRPSPLRFSKKKVFNVPFIASTAMIFLTMVTITTAAFAYRGSAQIPNESLVSEDLPNLQWEDPNFENRLQRTRGNLVNLTEDRTVVTPVYHNTYQVINTQEISAEESGIVLVNLK